MDATQLLVTILGAGGGGAAILALVNGLIKWLSGSATRERDRNTDLISQRRRAVQERELAQKERDEADKLRRNSEEYCSMLRRQLIEAGIDPEERPELPESETPHQRESYSTRERPPSLPTVPVIPINSKNPYE